MSHGVSLLEGLLYPVLLDDTGRLVGFIICSCLSIGATGAGDSVQLRFHCNTTVIEGQLTFVENDNSGYVFRYDTALACPPALVPCQAISNGQEYDLSALARTDGNWHVLDTRPGHDDLEYYINICRPINPVDGVTCEGLSGCFCYVFE